MSAENDALKRGLQRSSIVCFALAGIEEARADRLLSQGKELEEKLDALEKEIADLDKKRDASIESLNIEYANKLAETINKKLTELQKRQDEVLEYNNKVTELEHKYNIKIEEQRKQMQDNAQKQADEQNAKNQEQKSSEMVDVLTKYFSSFGKDKGIAELQKHTEIANKYGSTTYFLVYRNLVNLK